MWWKKSLHSEGGVFLVFWLCSTQTTFFWEKSCTLALKSAKYLSSLVFIPHSKTSDGSSSSDNKLGWLLDRWLWRAAACRWQSCLWLLTGRSAQTSKKTRFLMAAQTAKKTRNHLFTLCLSFIWSPSPWTKLGARQLGTRFLEEVLVWFCMQSLPGEAGFLYEILTLWINLQHVPALVWRQPSLCASAVVLDGDEIGVDGDETGVDTRSIQFFPGLLHWLLLALGQSN